MTETFKFLALPIFRRSTEHHSVYLQEFENQYRHTHIHCFQLRQSLSTGSISLFKYACSCSLFIDFGIPCYTFVQLMSPLTDTVWPHIHYILSEIWLISSMGLLYRVHVNECFRLMQWQLLDKSQHRGHCGSAGSVGWFLRQRKSIVKYHLVRFVGCWAFLKKYCLNNPWSASR